MKLIFTGCFMAVAIYAFTQTGNVGIGTQTPQARLHVLDGSVLFSATGSPNIQEGDPPVSGAGRRLMWYAPVAAFRAGYVTGSQWNKDNLGSYSFATGLNTIANGYTATSMGYANLASGLSSTALGANTAATGDYSTAIGTLNAATGKYATALGLGNTAASAYETVVGSYALPYTPASAIGYSATDRLFVIGNGVFANSPANAVTVLKNGNTGIGTATPAEKLEVTGTVKATAINTTAINTPSTGGSNMLAAAYGVVYSNGILQSTSGNCTINAVHNTGVYILTFTSANLSGTNVGNLPVLVSLFGGISTPGFITYHSTGNGFITVYTYNSAGVLTDRGFSFAVYKP